MRNRVLAAASALGLLLNGMVLARIGLGAGAPVLRGAVAAMGGQVGLALMVSRPASAAVRGTHEARDEAAPDGPDDAARPAPSAPSPEDGALFASAAPRDACAPGMILVEGDYCPDVRHECKHWLEESGKFAYYRCEEYTKATCLSKQREHKRYCIDRDEFVASGESLPASHQSWTNATQSCGALGKRVCLESEWNFACEGEEMRPYPYGWKRDPDACNADRVDIYRADGNLRDLRVGAGDKPACVSPFGVHNLSGNLEEWTTIDASASSSAPRPAMKGAYWQPSRNHCRANQTAHDRFYKGTETGFRCCSEAE